jgi:hypothetical protein
MDCAAPTSKKMERRVATIESDTSQVKFNRRYTTPYQFGERIPALERAG